VRREAEQEFLEGAWLEAFEEVQAELEPFI